MTRELTGRHVLIIVVTAFAVIIAANMTMLFAATGSFPGLVVGNSYVAGQGWDARAEAQRDLGWRADVSYQGGMLRVDLTDEKGHPIQGALPHVKVGRPTTDTQDRVVEVTADSTGFMAPIDLARGRWRIEVTVHDPAAFTTLTEIFIRGTD